MKLNVKHLGSDYKFKKTSPRHVAEHDRMKTDLSKFISKGLKEKSLKDKKK